MPATMSTARTDTLEQFRAAHAASSLSALPVHWPNVKKKRSKTRQGTTRDAKKWFRISWQIIDRKQSTVGGANGNRRFRTMGLVTVECYGPKAEDVADGTKGGELQTLEMVEMALGAFEGKVTTNGVEFFDVQPRVIGVEGNWYRMDVLSSFQFDEVRS